MPAMSPRMPPGACILAMLQPHGGDAANEPEDAPEAQRYELASLAMLVFINSNGFETETLRPKDSNHRGGRMK